MPPLVRLTDSEVELTDGVIPQASDGIEDGRSVLEKVSSCWLLIQQETLLPDLHIEPVHGDIQPCGQFWSSQQTGIMCPPVARRGRFDPGAAPDLLHGDQRHSVRAIGGAMAFAGEDRSDLLIGHTVTDEIEHPITHFHASRQLGDGVDLHLHFELGHSATAPDDSDQSDVVLAALEHDLVDETPQQRLALRVSRGFVRPNLG